MTKLTKNTETLERRYAKLGVNVLNVVRTLEGYLVADGFRCRVCGTSFLPGRRIRNRHRCPYGCNRARGGEGQDHE